MRISNQLNANSKNVHQSHGGELLVRQGDESAADRDFNERLALNPTLKEQWP